MPKANRKFTRRLAREQGLPAGFFCRKNQRKLRRRIEKLQKQQAELKAAVDAIEAFDPEEKGVADAQDQS